MKIKNLKDCKVWSTSLSRLEAHAGFFKIVYEGEIRLLLAVTICSNACDFTVLIVKKYCLGFSERSLMNQRTDFGFFASGP